MAGSPTPTRLIGRDAQQAVLRKALDSDEPELVAVYGRRRVGKTFLVREFYGARIRFELTGTHDATLREQLNNFALALAHAAGDDRRPVPPSDWQDAFWQLIRYLEGIRSDAKQVVFFDELPWLASHRSRFLPALEHFWNAWASRQRNLVVVVCGSAASWMIRNVIHQRGGLYNRVTRRVKLYPFSLSETEHYLLSQGVELGRRQILELYMAMGGVPHYLKEVDAGLSAAQNIDRICFAETGLLRDEFDRLYASLFAHPDRHVKVIRSLHRKRQGLTRNELLTAAGLSTGGGSSNVLDQLVESGFVMRCLPFGQRRKEALYRLADEYSLFYLSWIERHQTSGQHTWLSRASSPAWRAWSGYAFESICLKHAVQLKRALGIEGVETREACWSHRADDTNRSGAQIDLLIDRRDDCINLCEMKFAESEFVIDKRYAAELRNKRETFRRMTGTRKTLFLTMVTTYGVRPNSHQKELVASTVEMDALFS